ncbi:MAG: glycosyltransferase family 4 protein [Cyanobacteria bacterium P01_E01_bin.35]
MKILLVNDYATPTGGAELIMLALRRQLRLKGHDARLFASSARPLNQQNLADYQCLGTTSRYRTLLQSTNPWAYQKLGQVLSEFKPDVVHVRIFLTQLSPSILPLLTNIPTIYHVAWYRPICPLGTKILPTGNLCQDSVGTACYKNKCLPIRDWVPLMWQMSLWQRWRQAFNLVVANSHAVKDSLVAQGIKPVKVIWNGIPICPSRPLLQTPPTVVFAGRLVWEKGVDILIKAFAQVKQKIPDGQLLIAGKGEAEASLKSLIEQLGLQNQVTLLGHLSRPLLEEKLSHAWVQVVPSRWVEPFGIVAIESMMRGTAVIATDAGGLREIVCHQQTGLLIPSEDVTALANSLEQILSDRHLAEQMGKQGREVALEHFTENGFVAQFINLYHQITS